MRKIRRAVLALIATTIVATSGVRPAHASLARNAAGAKNIGESGRLVLDTAGEFERDQDGRVGTLEAAVQYQLTNRLQFLLEGTLLEAQRPEAGPRATGLGDTDVTLSWLLAPARGGWPSVVAGGKVKLPTATNAEIGTRKADFAALLVLGRESGELELSFEAEYARYGQPGGPRLKDQLMYTLTAEYGLNDFLSVYGELYGITAPTASDTRTDAGRLGVEFDVPIGERVAPYLSLEVSTEGVGVARAGVEWSW